MAQKAFVYGLTVADNGVGGVLATAQLQAIDNTNAPVPETMSSSTLVLFTDTVQTIRARLTAQIRTSFSDPSMAVVYLDDKGLL